MDRRTDIWSFGAVLYEMLTGARLFDGATVSDTMAKVLTQEADWTTLPAHTPAPIRRLLRRCLEKDRTRRLESAADARLEIEEAIATPAAEILPGGVAAPHASPRALVISLATAVLVAAGLAVPAVRYLRQVPASAPSETRLDIATPTTNDPVSFALSPNGQAIAFVASGDGPARLYLRSFDATTAQPLVGTDGAAYPFWSPDSRSVAFMAGDELKRLDLGGGAPRTLATAAAGRGGSWSTEGVVLFAPTAVGPLARVPAAGGPVTPATTLGEGQFGHRFPVFLPDGRHFLFHARGAADVNGIYLGSLDTAETTRLTAADTAGTYLPSGWLLWVRAGALTAQRLDVARGTLTGDPMTLADDVLIDSGTYLAAVSASASGLVAYRSGGASRRQLVWFGRSGTPLGTLGAPDDQALRYVRVSPDGRRVAVARTVQGKIDLWLLDDSRLSRFTFDSGSEYFPVWSPDGSRIVFASDRSGPLNLHVRPASGAGAEDVLVQSPQTKVPSDWSADGQYLLYSTLDPRTGWDIWVRPMAAVLRPTQHDPSESGPEHAPWAFANGPVAEAEGRFSPDGRWVAYESNASGRVEIYVRPFAPPPSPGASASPAGGQWQVSTDGGVYPVWRADGRELYYLGPDAAMMAVPISVRESTLEPETPVTLFRTRIFAGGADGGQGWQYDVTRDGRFLINTVLDDAVTAPITLIQNWTPPGS